MPKGIIATETSAGERTDYLFRVSLKAYIQNDHGEVLVVKEAGRTEWDLPGGGIDHGETIDEALKRELKEEVGYTGDFTYVPASVEDPHVLPQLDIYQLRVVVRVFPVHMNFSIGSDSDEICFMSPDVFSSSQSEAEKKILHYANTLKAI